MAVRTLSIDIMSYLKGKGFETVESQIKKVRGSLNNLKNVTGSPLFKMAAGFFTINKLASEYNKAIEASNLQLEQEVKLYATLKGQGFRDEQIQSIKDYASELQKVGIVGDEVTLAGAQQLATYNLTEQSLKRLLPALQDVMVQQKGLNGTAQDAVGVANMLAKGLLGQTGMLEKVGINLNERQRKMIDVGTQEEKVAALVEAVTMNVGKQNEEFAKTPEGKIVSAKNKIGDVYEYIGGLFRNVRADFFTLIADNDQVIQSILGTIVKTGISAFDTGLRTVRGIFDLFKSLPPEAKNTIKLLTAFFAIKKYPVAGIVLVLEDIFAAFQGKESYTEDAINAILKFLNYDYNFQDLRNDLKSFWHDITTDLSDANENINGVTLTFEYFFNTLKTGVGILQTFAGVIVGTKDIWQFVKDVVDDPEDFLEHFEKLKNGPAAEMISGGLNKIWDAGEANYDAIQRYQNGKQNKEIENYKKEYGEDPKETYYKTMKQLTPTLNDFSRNDIFKQNQSSLGENTINNKTDTNIFKEAKKTEVKYENNAKYEFNITGLNATEIGNQVETIIKNKEKEDKEKLYSQLGMDRRYMP